MVNRWTGSHDAVLELSPAGVDRVLAAMHRKGDRSPLSPDGPHLLHSIAFNLPLAGTAPGAEPDLRGHLKVQVSTPSVAVPPSGGPDRVRVSVQVYAWFQALPASAPAPEFLHGTLAITVPVRVFRCRGQMLAAVELARDDVSVEFTPASGSGATAADVALVLAAAPALLRRGIGSAQIPIGAVTAGTFTVRGLDFKTLRVGARTAFALLLSLRAPGASGSATPNPSQVNDIFLASTSPGDDAAVALGREFLTAVLGDFARGPLGSIVVEGSRFIGAFGVGFTLSFKVKLDPASFALELMQGKVRVRVSGSGSLSPGGSFGFRVTQDLTLTASNGKLKLALAAGVTIDITQGNALLKFVLGLVKGRLESRVEAALSGVVSGANDELNRVLSESVGGLLAKISLPGVKLSITHAAIDPDAVIAGGRFDVGPGPAVVAHLKDRVTSQSATAGIQTELDAFESWIPGGTVERYRFKQVSVKGATTILNDSFHRFVARVPQSGALPVLTGLGWPPTSWCVEVHGTQISGAGTQPAFGSICGMSVLTVGLDLGAAERLTVAVPDGSGGVLADVDPWGGYRPHAFAADAEARGFLLVHLWNGRDAEGVQALRAGLASLAPARGEREVPSVLATLIVADSASAVPDGARDAPDLALTHDAEGAWRKRFRLEPGDTALVGPGGKEIWRARGTLRADELVKALAGLRDARWGAKPRLPRQRALGLALGLGTLAPDVFLPCDGGVLVPSRKLRGREQTLVFWTSWSAPALEELRQLANAGAGDCADDDGARPLLLCINDGESPERAAAALKQHDLDVVLVTDPERTLARRFGVACWPTVVRIDREGRVAAVRLGLERAALEPAAGA